MQDCDNVVAYWPLVNGLSIARVAPLSVLFDNDLLEARKIISRRFLSARRALERRRKAVDFDALLGEVGLTWTDVGLASEKVTYDAFYHTISRLRRMEDLPGICFDVGRLSGIGDLGIFGYALLSASTLESSWEAAVENRMLFGSDANIATTISGEQVHITYEFNTPIRRDIIAVMEREISGTWALMCDLIPRLRGSHLTEIFVPYPRPSYAEAYETLRCPVRFNAGEWRIVFPREWLLVPFPLANEETATACRAHCRTIVEKLGRTRSVVERVRERLLRGSLQALPAFDQIAGHMNMSPATLRRRIQAEGMSFRHIVNEVKIAAAKEYLRTTDCTIQQITYLLGYSYPSTFHRAFQQQVQLTPLQYRSRFQRTDILS